MSKKSTLLFVFSISVGFLFSGCNFTSETPTPELSIALPTETATPEPIEPWEVVLELEGVEQAVRLAAFYDDKLGFTGGADSAGRFHSTHDGGQTWLASDTSSG